MKIQLPALYDLLIKYKENTEEKMKLAAYESTAIEDEELEFAFEIDKVICYTYDEYGFKKYYVT